MVDQKHATLNKFAVPFITFAIFIIPLIMDAVQIDLEIRTDMPVHWQLVMSATFSGGVATVLTLFKRLYEQYRIDYDKEIADLQHTVQTLALGRDLDEKKLMLTTATLNDEWLEKNVTIQQCEQLLEILKSKTAKVKDQQFILEKATNGMTVAIGKIDAEELEKQREKDRITAELEQLE